MSCDDKCMLHCYVSGHLFVCLPGGHCTAALLLLGYKQQHSAQLAGLPRALNGGILAFPLTWRRGGGRVPYKIEMGQVSPPVNQLQ